MWWCPEKADTRRKYRVLVLGCLRWGLHGPGCVPLTLSSGQDSIWYGLQSWALCIPFEGSVNVWHSVLFWEGYGWAEDTTLQTKHNVYNYCKNGSSTFLLVMNCFLIHPTVITAAINIQLQIFIQLFLWQKMNQSARYMFHLHGNWVFKVCPLSAYMLFVVSLLCEYFPFDFILDSLANQE